MNLTESKVMLRILFSCDKLHFDIYESRLDETQQLRGLWIEGLEELVSAGVEKIKHGMLTKFSFALRN
jgi:hypothetical protein